MSRPEPDPGHTRSLHPNRFSQPAPSQGLLEAYKKHVEELRGIEDRQNKTIALLLGIFSAAGTLLLKKDVEIPWPALTYITAIAVALLLIGQHAVNEFHDLRVAVRDLLVRCETALRFYETGAFLEGEMLYTKEEQEYAIGKGGWMKENYWIVYVVGGAFIFLLWLEYISHLSLPKITHAPTHMFIH
jgi:hypothetical protein